MFDIDSLEHFVRRIWIPDWADAQVNLDLQYMPRAENLSRHMQTAQAKPIVSGQACCCVPILQTTFLPLLEFVLRFKLLLLCSHSPNDVPPEPQRNVSIAAERGAVRPSMFKLLTLTTFFLRDRKEAGLTLNLSMCAQH